MGRQKNNCFPHSKYIKLLRTLLIQTVVSGLHVGSAQALINDKFTLSAQLL